MAAPTAGSDDDRTAVTVDVARFTYRHSLRLVAVSVGWLLASLPVVTAGPATLGAYVAVDSLREHRRVDVDRVLAVVRRRLLDSVLLAAFPPLLGVLTLLYVDRYARTGSTLALALAIVGVQVTGLAALVVVPTFAAMARGATAGAAVRAGYRWTAANPGAALAVGALTAVLAVVLGLLTLAFVALFGGVASALHLAYVSRGEAAIPPRPDDRAGDEAGP